MNLGSRCRYARDCEIFQGKKHDSQSSLLIHRNVFCNRGIKGWRNCDEYNQRLEQNDSSKTYTSK